MKRCILAAILGLMLAGPSAGQSRVPRLELLETGELGGEPHVPALAGGLWAREPLILGVEPDLDRSVLYRLPWLAAAPPAVAPIHGPAAGRASDEDAPELSEVLEGLVASGSPGAGPGAEVAPAAGRALPSEVAPSLPEILPFSPLPPGVEAVAVAGTSRAGLAAWVAREGTAEATNYRLAARRLGPDGASAGPDSTVQAGPGRPADLAIGIGPDGEALLAWTNHLPGRGAALHWRTLFADGELSPLRRNWEVPSDQGSPSVAPLGAGFGLAYLKTALEGQAPAASAPDNEADAPRGPARELLAMRINAAGGSARGEPAVIAAGRGLDQPAILARGGSFHVFWTDPRGGGRVLRTRTLAADGQPGAETAIRTDLRPQEPDCYRIAPAADGLWLVVWPQLEGRGRAMVVQARLFHSSGNAAGPPLLLGRSGGAVTLRDVVGSRGADRWIAVWTEEEVGRFRLRYRPLRLRS
jgi:hypothetical protein